MNAAVVNVAFPGDGELVVEPAPGPRASTMTFFAARGADRCVVRTPGGILPPTRDLVRELTIVRALGDTGLAPRPRSPSAEPGDAALVLEWVDGAPASLDDVIDALAALHAIVPTTPPRGNSDGSIERQLSRLTRRLEDTLERGKQVAGGKRKRAVRPLVEIGRWLRARLPAIQEPAICHGDPQPANAIRTSEGTRLVDWEEWSIGDPLTDVAWLLLWAPGADDPPDPIAPGEIVAGARERLVERYGRLGGRVLGDLTFYDVFARWRRAIALEQWYVERLHGNDDESLAALEAFVPALAERALALTR